MLWPQRESSRHIRHPLQDKALLYESLAVRSGNVMKRRGSFDNNLHHCDKRQRAQI